MEVWVKGIRLSRMGTMTNQLEFHLTTWKGDKMKCQQQGSHLGVTMRFALTMPPCNGMMIAVGGVLLKLRYVSCKVWFRVVVLSGTCTVRIHSLPPDRLALLSWQNAPSQHRDCYGDEMTLDLVSQHLGEILDTRIALSTGWKQQHRFRYPMNRLGAMIRSPKIERRSIMKRKHHDYACPAYWHLSGSYVS